MQLPLVIPMRPPKLLHFWRELKKLNARASVAIHVPLGVSVPQIHAPAGKRKRRHPLQTKTAIAMEMVIPCRCVPMCIPTRAHFWAKSRSGRGNANARYTHGWTNLRYAWGTTCELEAPAWPTTSTRHMPTNPSALEIASSPTAPKLNEHTRVSNVASQIDNL